jgi:hypothetical protein
VNEKVGRMAQWGHGRVGWHIGASCRTVTKRRGGAVSSASISDRAA